MTNTQNNKNNNTKQEVIGRGGPKAGTKEKKRPGRPETITRDKYVKALELYSSPSTDGKPVDLLTACNLVGISISHLRDVCDSDKELEALRTRARAARAELVRARTDDLLEDMLDGKRDVKTVETYVKRMEWRLERDSRRDYGQSHEVNMNVSQLPDFTRLSPESLGELKALLESGQYLPGKG